jgi:hypothetical protein
LAKIQLIAVTAVFVIGIGIVLCMEIKWHHYRFTSVAEARKDWKSFAAGINALLHPVSEKIEGTNA